VCCLAATALLLPGELRADTPKLTATVGPGFTISLQDDQGHEVTDLPQSESGRLRLDDHELAPG